MVMPLILLLVLGTVEYGLLFRDWLTVSNGSREGARVGTALGDDVNADCEIIKAVVTGLVAADIDNLQHIDVFESTSSGTPVPGNLNRYSYTGGAASDPLDCTNWAGPIGWASASRNVTVGPSDDLDILGVRVRFTHNWVTNFGPFSGTHTVEETTVGRLEPQAFE